MKYSVLTCIFNNYEQLSPPPKILNDNIEVEWICVSNTDDISCEGWNIIYRPDIKNFLYVKHHQYEFVSNDICVWFDGSYVITKDFSENLIVPFYNSDKELMISIHDSRYNIYEELAYWVFARNLNNTNANTFWNYLVNSGYHGGTLFQTSFMISKKTENILNIFNLVDSLETQLSVEGFYRDDQTTISYIIDNFYYKWDKIVLMDFEYTCNNDYFHWCLHNTNTPFPIKSNHNICWEEPQYFLYKIS